jgi:hypothetical protein
MSYVLFFLLASSFFSAGFLVGAMFKAGSR